MAISTGSLFFNPSFARLAKMQVDQCLDVGILGAEFAGVAEAAVVFHVDDERADFAFTQRGSLASCTLPPRRRSVVDWAISRCRSVTRQLRDPAVHRVVEPVS